MSIIKLLQVKGFYQNGKSRDFVKEQSWDGLIALREDLTFDGVVKDNPPAKDYDCLICGTLVDYNGISLIKFPNHGYSPCGFYGLSTVDDIHGGWCIYDYASIRDAGYCKIIIHEIPMDDSVLSDVTSKAEVLKSEMDSFSLWLYEGLTENIDLTVSNFIRNMDKYKKDVENQIGALKKLDL